MHIICVNCLWIAYVNSFWQLPMLILHIHAKCLCRLTEWHYEWHEHFCSHSDTCASIQCACLAHWPSVVGLRAAVSATPLHIYRTYLLHSKPSTPATAAPQHPLHSHLYLTQPPTHLHTTSYIFTQIHTFSHTCVHDILLGNEHTVIVHHGLVAYNVVWLLTPWFCCLHRGLVAYTMVWLLTPWFSCLQRGLLVYTHSNEQSCKYVLIQIMVPLTMFMINLGLEDKGVNIWIVST